MPVKFQRLILLLGLLPVLVSSPAWAKRNGHRWDRASDAFQFVDQSGVGLNALVNANSIIVSDLILRSILVSAVENTRSM